MIKKKDACRHTVGFAQESSLKFFLPADIVHRPTWQRRGGVIAEEIVLQKVVMFTYRIIVKAENEDVDRRNQDKQEAGGQS